MCCTEIEVRLCTEGVIEVDRSPLDRVTIAAPACLHGLRVDCRSKVELSALDNIGPAQQNRVPNGSSDPKRAGRLQISNVVLHDDGTRRPNLDFHSDLVAEARCRHRLW